MANTYNWLIESLDCIPSLDNQTNVVSKVHWRINCTDDVNNATVYGEQKLDYTLENQFIVFDNLTKETVIGWVQKIMGEEHVASLYALLDNQLDALANPATVSLPMPWANNA
jgi:hypothetical protein